MLKLLRQLSQIEKLLIVFLVAIIVAVNSHLAWLFYQAETEVLPAEGGTYAEGVVGELKLINPVFANQNPLDADLSKLIFAGLMKYDPQTQTIVDDLATHTLSVDKKTYTFVIKDKVFFHDGQPLTAEDVLFTFKDVIQNPNFKNEILQKEFVGIEINQIDTKTITFTLPEPYKFFLTNLTIGILPKHSLADLPVENLQQSSFNRSPIGAGPYQFDRILVSGDSIDVHLKKFTDYYGEKTKLTGVIFKIYRNYQTLLKNLDTLNGVKNIPKEEMANFPKQNRYQVVEYHLPQYVALFLNTDAPLLKNQKVRLALQLATDRKTLADKFGENLVIDDPLMESNSDEWIYQYDPEKAAGALYDSGWFLPKKTGTGTKVKETKKETKTTTGAKITLEENFTDFWKIPKIFAAEKYIYSPGNGADQTTSQNEILILGKAPEGTVSVMVNDYVLQKYKPEKLEWSYRASLTLGTMKKGKNIYNIYAIGADGVKQKIDDIVITWIKKEPAAPVAVEKPVATPTVKTQTTTGAQIASDSAATEAKTQSGKQSLTQTGAKLTEKPAGKEPEPVEDLSQIRQNKKGEKLVLRLITSQTPDFYGKIAQEIKQNWETVGVKIKIEVLAAEDFKTRVNARDYDIVLYGQSLGYNLDAYPYWHSSQANGKGLNLSNYSSFEADMLLEEMRMTHNEPRRETALNKLKKTMRNDLPAILLYRPVYYFAYDPKIQNIKIADNLPTMSDRFGNIATWYTKEDRFFKPGQSWRNFWSWIRITAWR